MHNEKRAPRDRPGGRPRRYRVDGHPAEANALDRPPGSRNEEAPVGDHAGGRRSPRQRRILIGAVGVAVVVLAATTLAGFLAKRWWVFELASNLRFHLALALLLAAAALLGLRALATAELAMGAAALNLIVIALVLASHAPGDQAPAPGEAALEVTFFNTKIVHADMDRTIEVLARRDDDIVILAGGTLEWVERLQSSDLDLDVVLGPHTHDQLELIALAADPEAEVAVHQLGEERRDVFVEVATELDGRRVRVLGTHVVSPLTAERAARRDAMLAWIPGWIEQVDDAAVVVGDLNATPWSPALESVLEHGGLVDSQRGHGLQPSYPASMRWLGIPIDHVLHTSELTTTERRLGPSLGSDHRMIHATLAPERETE